MRKNDARRLDHKTLEELRRASEETNTKSDVALTEIQILARNSLRFAPGAASVDFSRY